MEFILLDFIFKIASNLLEFYLNWTPQLLLQSMSESQISPGDNLSHSKSGMQATRDEFPQE